MALQIPGNNAASIVSCDLSDLIEQLPECRDKTISRDLNSYIEGVKGVLYQKGCSDAVLAVNNLQSCTRQLLISVINNADDYVIGLQSQEVCRAVQNTVAVMRMNHPDELDRVHTCFQTPPAGIEYRRVDLQQGSEDFLERLAPFYTKLGTPYETRPVIQLPKSRSSPSNPATETERTPLLGSQSSPNENRQDEFDEVSARLQDFFAGIGDQRVDLQQGSKDLLERLVTVYEKLVTQSETRPVIQQGSKPYTSSKTRPASQPQNQWSTRSNPARTPLIEPQKAPNKKKKKALRIVGGLLVGVTGVAALVGGVALACTGIGAPVGAALIGAEVGIGLAVTGGVTAVTAGGVAVTTGTAGAIALHKSKE